MFILKGFIKAISEQLFFKQPYQVVIRFFPVAKVGNGMTIQLGKASTSIKTFNYIKKLSFKYTKLKAFIKEMHINAM